MTQIVTQYGGVFAWLNIISVSRRREGGSWSRCSQFTVESLRVRGLSSVTELSALRCAPPFSDLLSYSSPGTALTECVHFFECVFPSTKRN